MDKKAVIDGDTKFYKLLDIICGIYYTTPVETGKMIIIAGVILILTGLVIHFRDALPWIKNLGHLPGDIVVKKENFTFYFPIVTSLVISLLVSFLMFLIRRLR